MCRHWLALIRCLGKRMHVFHSTPPIRRLDLKAGKEPSRARGWQITKAPISANIRTRSPAPPNANGKIVKNNLADRPKTTALTHEKSRSARSGAGLSSVWYKAESAFALGPRLKPVLVAKVHDVLAGIFAHSCPAFVRRLGREQSGLTA